MITQKPKADENTFPLDHNDYYSYYRTQTHYDSKNTLKFFPSYDLIRNFIKNNDASISIIHSNKVKIPELTIQTRAYLNNFPQYIPDNFTKPTRKLQTKEAYSKFYLQAFLNFISHIFLYIFPNEDFFHLYITHFSITTFTIAPNIKEKVLNQNIYNDLNTKDNIYSTNNRSFNFIEREYHKNPPIPYLAAYSIITAIPKDRDKLEGIFEKLLEHRDTPPEKNSGKQAAVPLGLTGQSKNEDHLTNFIEINIALEKASRSYIDISFSSEETSKDEQYLFQFPFYKNFYEKIQTKKEIYRKKNNKDILRDKLNEAICRYTNYWRNNIKIYSLSNYKSKPPH